MMIDMDDRENELSSCKIQGQYLGKQITSPGSLALA